MFLDPEDSDHKWMFDSIKRRCRSRGLEPILDGYWEKHGPHGPDFPCIVYIGECRELATGEEGCVVFYPRQAFWLDFTYEWSKPNPENEILPIRRSEKAEVLYVLTPRGEKLPLFSTMTEQEKEP